MRELSLFSGAGGGLLGSLLLGWTPIGYVEFNDYCQRVIAQRIRDGILPNAPIFGDVRKFLESGAAREYRGFADVVTAGWPCQPHSLAGERKGAGDEREGWPYVIETIRQVRPRWFLGENVRGVLSTDAGRYFGNVLRDLAESGYDARWRVLSAAELGAPHQRDRLWIVAYANGFGHQRQATRQSHLDEERHDSTQERGGVAIIHAPVAGGQVAANPARRGQPRPPTVPKQARQSGFEPVAWWQAEPGLDRLVDGMAHRTQRIRAAGNGQVPLCAALAFLLLAGGEQ